MKPILMIMLAAIATAFAAETMLIDFKDPSSLKAWDVRKSAPPTTFTAAQGEHGARLAFPRWQSGSTEWPAVILTNAAIADWAGYTGILLNCKNPENEKAFTIRVDGPDGKQSFFLDLKAPAGVSQVKGVFPKQCGKVTRVHLFMTKPAADTELFFGWIKLVQ